MREDEILDHLDLMLESIELIEKRCSRIRLPEDFVLSIDGVTLLDAVSMRLQGAYSEAERHPAENTL
jgi:hypothetical protein